MKKFFAALIVAATLLICQNPAQAVDVRLCDYTVESVLNFLKRAGDELGIDVGARNIALTKAHDVAKFISATVATTRFDCASTTTTPLPALS